MCIYLTEICARCVRKMMLSKISACEAAAILNISVFPCGSWTSFIRNKKALWPPPLRGVAPFVFRLFAWLSVRMRTGHVVQRSSLLKSVVRTYIHACNGDDLMKNMLHQSTCRLLGCNAATARCYRRSSVVCMSVCLLVHELCKSG